MHGVDNLLLLLIEQTWIKATIILLYETPKE